jgi:hypothetical protein
VGGAAAGGEADVVEAFDLTGKDEEEIAEIDVERWIAEYWVERVVKTETGAAVGGGAAAPPAVAVKAEPVAAVERREEREEEEEDEEEEEEDEDNAKRWSECHPGEECSCESCENQPLPDCQCPGCQHCEQARNKMKKTTNNQQISKACGRVIGMWDNYTLEYHCEIQCRTDGDDGCGRILCWECAIEGDSWVPGIGDEETNRYCIECHVNEEADSDVETDDEDDDDDTRQRVHQFSFEL